MKEIGLPTVTNRPDAPDMSAPDEGELRENLIDRLRDFAEAETDKEHDGYNCGNLLKMVESVDEYIEADRIAQKQALDREINESLLAELEDLDEWDAYDIKDELKHRIKELRAAPK